MDQLLSQITQASSAVEQSQQALASLSVDDCPAREAIAAALSVAYQNLGEALKIAQG